jgi:hypothetical protein
MTVEELLIPRCRVLADYPNSYFKVGDILTGSPKIPTGAVGKFINDTTGWAWVFTPEKYRSIFQKVFWYEERRLEDLPKYIRIKDLYYEVKWKENLIREASPDTEDDNLKVDFWFNKQTSVPLTEEQFLRESENFQEPKKKP